MIELASTKRGQLEAGRNLPQDSASQTIRPLNRRAKRVFCSCVLFARSLGSSIFQMLAIGEAPSSFSQSSSFICVNGKTRPISKANKTLTFMQNKLFGYFVYLNTKVIRSFVNQISHLGFTYQWLTSTFPGL